MTKIALGKLPDRPEGTNVSGLTTKLWNSDGLPTGRASERMPDYQKVRGEGWVTGCAVELVICGLLEA